jgi:hypothetical protein
MALSYLPSLVKGAGYCGTGGIRPWDDNDDRVFSQAAKAEKAIRAATKRGIESPDEVVKGFSGDFMGGFGGFLGAQPQNRAMSDLVGQLNGMLGEIGASMGKNFTLSSPLSTGLVPFDLLAPSRLIYPVYSPMRNKIPRMPGQGNARLAKIFTGITGSRTGGSVGNAARWSISELPSGGSLSSWPTQLPPSGAQQAYDLNVPYKYFGKTEALTWLAQFAGQGFEDVSSLANLILLQEAMIAEEDQIFSGTGTALAQPASPTVVPRAAASFETAVTGVTTNVYVLVTALNYYGETAYASGNVNTCTTFSGSEVIDVKITPVKGAFQYRVYVATGTANPGSSGFHLVATVGGTWYTIQGALPTSTASPSTVDTGTNSSNDFEGLLSVIDGWATTNTVYPASFSGVGVNKSAALTLSIAAVNPVLEALWDTGTTVDGLSNAFRANPSELVCEGTDAANFASDILSNNADASAYHLFISQDEVGGIRTGAAVSEYQNPITRAVLKVLVHPWLTQGSCFFMSYTLPMSWTNTPNCWEMVMVQDLISIAWPVIDMSFRYSIAEYGSLVGYGPQYSSVLQGLQKTSKSSTSSWS